MKTDISKYNNAWYEPGNPIRRSCWYMFNRFFLNTSLPYPSVFKNQLLRFFGAKIGTGVVIKPQVNIKYPWFLCIGSYVWIGENVWIDNLTRVTIGSNVCISQGALLLCGNHNYSKTTFDLMVGPITLEDGVWIGAKSVVCPGVTCKSHSVLAVGSVASHDLEAYSIYQGNPAQKVKDRVIKE